MKEILYPVPDAHSLTNVELCNLLQTDSEKGLSASQVEYRLQTIGRNKIEHKRSKSSFLIFLDQFKSPMAVLLGIASVVSFFFNEWLNGSAILLVIFLNTSIGFLMEYQAERSMEALRKLTELDAKVIRNNKLEKISSEKIVPGDILFLEAGDMIPADARVYSLSQFHVDESALTGESIPVEKQEIVLSKNASLADRFNTIYNGTFVTKGNAKCLVTGTAMQTELGKIATMVQTAEQAVTPLEKKLEEFSKKLIKVTVVLVVFIFSVGIINGQNVLIMLQTSIALAVAAIPEGLPIVATLALAQGMLKMARRNVIVKKLACVETLGGVNVICADKTGTLTQNKIEVNTVFTTDGKVEILSGLTRSKPSSNQKSFELIKKISVLCNTANLVIEGDSIKEIGDPLEIGLLKFAHADGIEILKAREENPKIREDAFSSETKIMATLHKSGKDYIVVAKGAAEEIIKICTKVYEKNENKEFHIEGKNNWTREAEKLSQSGLKVIGVAFKNVSDANVELKNDLVFVGLIGMLDPPRDDVFDAIRECSSAGIDVVMITGDHPETAKNIALKLGIIGSENERVIQGKEMKHYEELNESEKLEWIHSKIFARVSPKQKLDLITVLQEKHFIVAMTGDGVNDAPALKKADIGIAMGMRGTQVAQDVAGMVLKDDSFSSIVFAVKQGRVIFSNIRKSIVYLLSSNMSELFIISVTSLFSLKFQLFPLQILFINLISDVFPALALGMTEGNEGTMKQNPRKKNEPVINSKLWISIVVYAGVITLCILGSVLFSYLVINNADEWNDKSYNNLLFYTLIFSQLLHVFNMSGNRKTSFYKSELFKNKYIWYALVFSVSLSLLAYVIIPIRGALSVPVMQPVDGLIIIGFSLLSLILIQLLKRWKIVK